MKRSIPAGHWVVIGLLLTLVPTAHAQTPPGVVIDYYDPANGVYISSPSIVILPNGDYVATHDQYGAAPLVTHVFRSQDAGSTWAHLTLLLGQYESTLFVHDAALYLIGGFIDAPDEYAAIRKSIDGGQTWTEPLDPNSGLLTPAGRYNGAPGPVLVHNGRIWRAIEEVDLNVPTGMSREFRAMMLSVPVDADPLDGANWTVSNSILMLDYIANVGWFEGNALATPTGDVVNILRIGGMSEKAAVVQVSPDGQTVSFDPQTIIDFFGGASKFTIRYDPLSGRYWSLVNKQADPPAVRNRLVLTSSADLVNWTVESVILENPDSANIGFQYADWQFDGEDIIAVSRTAFGGASNFHDAEYLTFHRIPSFRLLNQASTTTVHASDDAEIDGHVNWRSDPKGIPQPQWNHTAAELRIRIYDPIAYPGAEAGHALVKWDLSGIPPGDIVTAVSLEMAGWDYPDGSIEVYAVNTGDWDEATVTWNNWAATAPSLVLLGELTSAGPAGSAGSTVFVDDDLTSWVQDWLHGAQDNYGLLFKMGGSTPGGDSFSAHEDTWASGHPPRLVIQHIPASAYATVQGTAHLSGYSGDLRHVAIQVELRQNGVLARSERMLLDSAGRFSIPLVPLGTYDVAVQTSANLQKVLTNVNVSADPTDLGTAQLTGGDLNGDAAVNLLDFAIMARNWLATEQP